MRHLCYAGVCACVRVYLCTMRGWHFHVPVMCSLQAGRWAGWWAIRVSMESICGLVPSCLPACLPGLSRTAGAEMTHDAHTSTAAHLPTPPDDAHTSTAAHLPTPPDDEARLLLPCVVLTGAPAGTRCRCLPLYSEPPSPTSTCCCRCIPTPLPYQHMLLPLFSDPPSPTSTCCCCYTQAPHDVYMVIHPAASVCVAVCLVLLKRCAGQVL